MRALLFAQEYHVRAGCNTGAMIAANRANDWAKYIGFIAEQLVHYPVGLIYELDIKLRTSAYERGVKLSTMDEESARIMQCFQLAAGAGRQSSYVPE